MCALCACVFICMGMYMTHNGRVQKQSQLLPLLRSCLSWFLNPLNLVNAKPITLTGHEAPRINPPIFAFTGLVWQEPDIRHGLFF